MIVITAAGGSLADCAVYRSIIEAQARKCKEFGYRHRIYNLGNLGIGEFRAVPDFDFKLQVNGDSLPAATFKAALVAENLADGVVAPMFFTLVLGLPGLFFLQGRQHHGQHGGPQKLLVCPVRQGGGPGG